MRPKVLLGALLAAGVLVGFAVWLAGLWQSPSGPTPFASGNPSRPPPLNQAHQTAVRHDQQTLNVSGHLSKGDAKQALDPDSMDGILADLEQPGAEIHQAALQRARELDDRSIIPRLREIAARTGDAREKADILDTIDFLNLPSIDENMADARAARAAAGLSDPPPSPTNRWTGRPFARHQ
jgi:hypothetical protein